MTGIRDTLRLAVDAVIPLVLLFSLFLLLVGHDQPGGGFAGGLLAAGALGVDAIAHRGAVDDALRRRLPPPQALLGIGLTLAAVVAMAPLAFGQPLLESTFAEIGLGALGTAKVSTVLIFDIGVFLIVVGLVTVVLDRVREVAA